jgi:hypothetical protein
MDKEQKRLFAFNGFSRATLLGVILAMPVALAGCSSVPDAANPVEWYKGVLDVFSGEDEDVDEAQNSASNQGTEGNIGLVAEPARPVSRNSDSAPRAEGLVPDKINRRYAAAIPRQGESISSLGEQSTIVAQAPAPPASPAVPVTPAPIPNVPGALIASPALPTVGEMAPPPPQLSNSSPLFADTLGGLARDDFSTVVISSSGVEVMGSGQAASPFPAAPAFPAAPSGEASGLVLTGQGGGALASAPAPVLGPGALMVATIVFPHGAARLSAKDRQIIEDVVRLQKERGGKLRVIGHASSRTRDMDPIRHKMVNFSVSANRAEKVAQELLRQGVKKENVSTTAMSDTQPLYYEIMPSGEAGNRRTDIYLEG